MRPLKLTMQAFGPYAGRETIDFTLLENRTMFVISGKTGSGKTTIFDGISFCIYGKASGDDREGTDLRSQFSDEDLLTEVELEFSLRGKTYFIKRSPQQERKKKNGEGVTKIGAKAELSLIENGVMKLLAANVRDVGERIKEIMLIDSNQFRQIVMIPQGEFRKLLNSDSTDKEKILQRLFHTEIFKRIEKKLDEESSDLNKLVKQQVDNRNQAIHKIEALFNEELKDYLDAKSENDTIILPLLMEEIKSMDEHLLVIQKDMLKKQEERDQLQQKLNEAKKVIEQLQKLEQLRAEKEKLTAQKRVFQKKEEDIILANKAALLSKQEELCHRLKRELDHANNDLHHRKLEIEQLTALLQEKERAFEQEKNREGEREAQTEVLNHLQHIKDDIFSFAKIQNEVELTRSKLEEAKTRRQAAEEANKKTEEDWKNSLQKSQELEKSQITILENERRLDKLNAELELLRKFENQVLELNKGRKQRQGKEREFQAVLARMQDAKSVAEKLELQWFHGQAAILANSLSDGEACPVCGSEHHPRLARSASGEIPNEQDLKQAKADVSGLEKEKSLVESALYECQSRVSVLEESVLELKKEMVSQRNDFQEEDMVFLRNELIKERNELKESQQILQKNFSLLEKLYKKIHNLEEQKKQYTEQFAFYGDKVNELAILFTEKNTEFSRMKESIPADLRTIPAFEEKWKRAGDKLTTLQRQLETAEEQYLETRESHAKKLAGIQTVEMHTANKKEELKKEREIFVKNMAEQGFANYSSYDQAKKSREAIEGLERVTRTYREEFRSVSDRFNEHSEAMKNVKVPNMEEINLEYEKVNDQFRTLMDKTTNLKMKKRDNEEILDTINRINLEMKAAEERYKILGHLAEMAKGQNTHRITFERYVLAAFLDDILQVSNERLAKMTSGRYQLLRKTDRSKGNVQSGLELLVYDQYTGGERHVKTLSGGESFKAALSLALGLADVVQEYAGGVSLETMFIDEGFGTLDPESLDQAIESLIDIQSSGRLVGIISHVPELKERMDARLEVIATQTGSVTEFQFLN